MAKKHRMRGNNQQVLPGSSKNHAAKIAGPSRRYHEQVQSFIMRLESSYSVILTDRDLLLKAMEHPSLTCTIKPRPLSVFERLEFLGDRVLNLAVADYLVTTYSQEHEGELARRHSYLVKADTLAEVATSLEVGEIIRTQKNVADQGGVLPSSILADAVEVLYGCVFQTLGYDVAAGFVMQTLAPYTQELLENPLDSFKDAKSGLQELYLKMKFGLPAYATEKIGGFDHAPIFEAVLVLPNGTPLSAQGASKRLAEHKVAEMALKVLST